jgi:tetratricopeptide (TPR) repeat protein
MPLKAQHRDEAERLYFLGIDKVAEGDARAATEMFRASLALDPAFLDARHGLIRALQDAGEFDQAIAAAGELIALDPEDVLAHTSLSILYQRKGMVPEAEAEALQAKLLGWKLELRAGRAASPSE